MPTSPSESSPQAPGTSDGAEGGKASVPLISYHIAIGQLFPERSAPPPISLRERDGATIAKPSLNKYQDDLSTEPLKAALLKELEDARCDTLLIDLSDVRLADTGFLNALVAVCNRCLERGHKFGVYGSQPLLRDALTITKLGQLFTVAADKDAALAAISAQEQQPPAPPAAPAQAT